LVNPIHEFGASIWLGTLFVLVWVCLRVVVYRSAGNGRGAMVAELIQRFSPVALAGAGVVGISGVVTSWLKLKTLSALWTTPFGYVLLIKLALVGIIAALGAWNWRRLTPKLGTDEGAVDMRHSAKIELWFAAVVLVVTAVLVAVPTGK
jgi:putative copper export protein